jgi:hypothetical protein
MHRDFARGVANATLSCQCVDRRGVRGRLGPSGQALRDGEIRLECAAGLQVRADGARWRAGGDKAGVVPSELYTNRFVDNAMKAIH